MKLSGIEVDNISEDQLSKNLQRIDALQLQRIEALKQKYREFNQYQNMSAVRLHSVPVH
jgi:hypothetical protein